MLEIHKCSGTDLACHVPCMAQGRPCIGPGLVPHIKQTPQWVWSYHGHTVWLLSQSAQTVPWLWDYSGAVVLTVWFWDPVRNFLRIQKPQSFVFWLSFGEEQETYQAEIALDFQDRGEEHLFFWSKCDTCLQLHVLKAWEVILVLADFTTWSLQCNNCRIYCW